MSHLSEGLRRIRPFARPAIFLGLGAGSMREGPGVAYIALGAFWISLGALCIKLLGSAIPVMEMVLFRSLVGVPLCLLVLHRDGLSPLGNRRVLLLARGVVGFTAMTCAFFAIVRLPLADATLFFFMHPVFAVVLAVVFLRERVGVRSLVGIGLALAGLALLSRPPFLFGGAGHDPLGVLVALLGALFAGGAIVMVRKIGLSEHPMVIVLYQALVMLPVSLAFSLGDFVVPAVEQLLLLLGIGLALNTGQYFLTMGFAREPPGRAGAMAYLQVVFATIWGAVVFREYPDGIGLLGAVLVVGGSLAVQGAAEG